MKFSEVVAQTLDWLQREGRVSYRALRLEFDLTEEVLDALKEELIEVKELAVDKDGKMLVWKDGLASSVQSPESKEQEQTPTVQRLDARPRTLDAAAERRQLTVMFCDLVGSTALSEQLDPEEYREVVRAYHETCADVISLYAGHTAQHLGDGLLVYFGYPVAHEDDAARAVRTGLEIITALQKKHPSSLVRERQGEGVVGAIGRSPLQVRIGIHTGLVVVGEIGSSEKHEILALGETPNLAARLQGLAAPDTVVISTATQRLVVGLFTCQDLGPQALKGLTTPVTVYQVLGESGAQSRFEAAVQKGLTPFVGREHEVGLLQERWEQAKQGAGQVVLLSGEPGIGKSRLVQELKEQLAQEGVTRIEFRCSPYHQNSALYPIIDHLQRLLQFMREDAPAAKLEKLQHRLSHYRFPQADTLPLLAALLSLPHPEGSPPITVSPQKQKEKTHAALVAWMVEEAERAAVCYAWEDLHWADPSTLEVLTLFLGQVPTTRVLVLLTFRPEFTPSWGNRSHLSQMTLSRLGRPQVEAMVERVTGGKALPPEVMQQIVAKTDGVPLFVEELTKTVVESGLLTAVNDHYELSGPLPPLAIPSTLQDSLMARLDRLSTVREIAQLGATLGREFSYELLQAVSPLDEERLQQGLKQLVEAELVYQRGLVPQATYLFKHALIQDTAYQSLLKSTRQQSHRQIAQVLEARFTETVETQPELVAHHYTEAGLIEQALPYWQQAGQQAARRSAHVEALHHLTKGLELLATLPDTPERAQQELTLQIALGESLVATRGYGVQEVEQAFTQALELCRQVGETPQLFHALGDLFSTYYMQAKLQKARELAEQLLRFAHNLQDPILLVQAHLEMGTTLFWLGESTSALAHLEQAASFRDLQKDSSHPMFVFSLSHLAGVLGVLGYPDQALKKIHEAFTLARQTADPFTLAWALAFAARLSQLRGEVQKAQEQAEAVISLSTEYGFPHWLAWATILRGWALAEQGQGEEGIAQIHQGLTVWQATGAELGRSYFLALLIEAYGQTRQTEEGLTLLAEVLAVAHKNEEHGYEAELYRLKGQLTLQSQVESRKSKVEEAEACFLKAIEIAQRQQAKSLELRATTSLARLWQSQGKTTEARDMLSTIYNWFTEGFDTKDLQEAKALLESLSP